MLREDRPRSASSPRFLLLVSIGLVGLCLQSLAQTSASIDINNPVGGGNGYCTSSDPGPCPVTTISTEGTVTWAMDAANGTTNHTTTSDSALWDSGDLCASGQSCGIAGASSFHFTFTAPGTYTYHCNVHPNMHGTVNVNPDATQFVVSLPTSVTAGSSFSFTVTAEDAFGNKDTNFNGKISFTSDDPHPASLPGTTPLVNGSGTFTATLFTTGSRSITVSGTDPIHGAISGSGGTTAQPAGLDHLVIAAPSSAKAGANTNFTVTAYDPFSNVKTDYSGTVHFSSSDSAAVLPADSPLTNGGRSFGATFTTTGAQTLSVNDSVSTGIKATATITVNPASCNVSDQSFNNGPATVSFAGGHEVCNPFCFFTEPVTNPYPSAITVSLPAGEVVGHLTVTVNGLTEDHDAGEVEMLLVGPGGQELVLMSNAAGNGVGPIVSPIDLTFDDNAPTALPGTSALSSGTFRPAAYFDSSNLFQPQGGPAGPYPAPAPTGTATLESQFAGINPNGTWNLYVVDLSFTGLPTPFSGSITGWSLDITPAYGASNPAAIQFDDFNASPTNPYPSTIQVSGVPGNIAKIAVSLNSLTFNCPGELALLLQGPHGEIVPMSLVGPDCGGSGSGVSGVNLTLEDDAASPLPFFGNPMPSGSYQPASYALSHNTLLAFPSPPGPYPLAAPDGTNTFASTFNGTDPNGTWNLYVESQAEDLGTAEGTGSFAGGWSLRFELQCATCATAVTASSSSGPNVTSSAFNQPVTFTGTTSSNFEVPNANSPNAFLVFCDGAASGGNCTSASIGTGALDVNGHASVTTSSLSVGVHSITVNYPGNSTYPPSTSAPLAFTVAKGPTNTTVQTSRSPSVFGQAVTFTATVVPTFGGVPTGFVTFEDGGVPVATVALSSGMATATTSALTASGSPHSITAIYPSDANFAGSTSSALTQMVNKANSSTVLGGSLNPSNYGSSVTFTATVSSGAGTPGGTVTFCDGAIVAGSCTGTALGTATLTAGKGTVSTNSLTVGAHSINALYSGASDYNSSAASTLIQTVNKQSTTTSALTSKPSGGLYGQSITFTASASASITGPSALSGTVTFKDNGVALAPAVALNSGIASLTCAPGKTCSALNAGSHPITAVYSGDGNYATSMFALTQMVNKTATTSAISSSANPLSFGQSVTLSATIASQVNGVFANGNVTFCDGAVISGACTGTTLGTPTLNAAGVATLAVANLQTGSHTLNALYGGSSNFNASDSTAVPLTQIVNKADTTTTLTVKQTPEYLPSTQDLFRHQIALTASVTSGAGVPGCTVTFKDNGVPLAPAVTLTAGKATLILPRGLGKIGLHPITAAYNGCANFNPSNSATWNEYQSPKGH